MAPVLAAIDWPTVALAALWGALAGLALHYARLGAVAVWHALAALLRAFRGPLGVTLAKRGLKR